MKLFKNIYTFLVGENKDVTEMCNYPVDSQAISNNLFVYDEFIFDKEVEEVDEVEEVKEVEEVEEVKEVKEVEKVEEVEVKKYWLYSEEYKDDFIEEFVNELKQRALL
jgi:hypothetical protein